jgi:hypothetical protein
VEPNDADPSLQHLESDQSSASTLDVAGRVQAGDLSALAGALLAAALAVHGQPAACQALAERSGVVAGSARWRFHPPGQRDPNSEDGCVKG